MNRLNIEDLPIDDMEEYLLEDWMVPGGYKVQDARDPVPDEKPVPVVVKSKHVQLPPVGALQAITTVGAEVVGYSKSQEVPLYQRNFTDLVSTTVVVDNSIVVAWDFPMTGCVTVQDKMMSNLQLNAWPPLVHGTGESSLAVSAVREKKHGIEAAQFVAFLSDGRRVAFLWYGNKIRRVEAPLSALYEMVEEVEGVETFFLLSGARASDIDVRDNPWLPITKEIVQDVAGDDGVMIMANSLEYRVKRVRGVALEWFRDRPSVACDANGMAYDIVNVVEESSDGICEFEILDRVNVRYLYRREDRDSPDNDAQVALVLRSVTLDQFLKYLPDKLDPREPVPLSFRYPGCTSLVQFRNLHSGDPDLGPYQWANQRKREPTAMLATYVKKLASRDRTITFDALHRDLITNKKYARSGVVVDVPMWSDQPYVEVMYSVKLGYITNVPCRGVRLILVLSTMPTREKAAKFKNFFHRGYHVLFCHGQIAPSVRYKYNQSALYRLFYCT